MTVYKLILDGTRLNDLDKHLSPPAEPEPKIAYFGRDDPFRVYIPDEPEHKSLQQMLVLVEDKKVTGVLCVANGEKTLIRRHLHRAFCCMEPGSSLEVIGHPHPLSGADPSGESEFDYLGAPQNFFGPGELANFLKEELGVPRCFNLTLPYGANEITREGRRYSFADIFHREMQYLHGEISRLGRINQVYENGRYEPASLAGLSSLLRGGVLPGYWM